MDHFKLHSEYKPTGDQPQAIKALVEGFKEGNQCQTLLGVTGSGKTFTMANVIQQLNKPTLILSLIHIFVKNMFSKERRQEGGDDGKSLTPFQAISIAIGGTAVSYTHLDVYKRQGRDSMAMRGFEDIAEIVQENGESYLELKLKEMAAHYRACLLYTYRCV